MTEQTTQTAHTPGPWRVAYDEDAAATMLHGSDGLCLAELLSVLDGDDRLIAAAPDLLAACTAALELAAFAYVHSNDPNDGPVLGEISGILQEAVDKATGAAR